MNTKILVVLLIVCITIICTVCITVLSNNAEKDCFLEIKETTITNMELTLIIKNPTLNDYMYSYSDYYLEKFDDIWSNVPYTEFYIKEWGDVDVTKLGHPLRPLSTVKMEIDWSQKYGAISAGTYRISYQISGRFYTSTEFTIN
jgi:hypothetical protein